MVSRHIAFMAVVAASLYVGSITCVYADPAVPCSNPPTPGVFCISGTELSGIDEILKGSSATYTLTVTGRNAGAGKELVFNVLSDSSDVPMVDDTKFVVKDDASGKWSFSFKFTLKCTTDCMIVGPIRGSGVPSPARITATIEESGPPAPPPQILDRSNTLTVECTTAPEPATIILLGTGLGGVAALSSWRASRRRRSSHS